MTLLYDERDIGEAERFNRVLRLLPRYRTDRRMNARVIQAILRAWETLPRLSRRSDVDIEERSIDRDGRTLRLRLVIPRQRPAGIYLTFHGGAWVMGTPRFDDPINSRIAAECRALVISVDHHLAVDDRLDLAIEDARRAAEWAAAEAAAEFGAERIVAGGESSGAHLAALALLHLRTLCPDRLAGAVLFYGAYDMAGTPGLRRSSSRSLLIDGQAAYRNLLRLTSQLTEEQRRDPRLSPLFADLSGMPPALFVAGELDPVFEDSLRMAERWNEANGNAEFLPVPRGAHGFNRLPLSMARKTNAHARQRIRHWLECGLSAS
nr:cutinase family protein [Rhizobium sp. Q54]